MTILKARRLAVVLVAGAVSLLPAGASQSATSRVKATDSRTWSPDFRHIGPGNRIVWKNPTSARHTLTAWKGRWSKDVSLAPGERTAKKFKRKGQYYYRCTIHSTVIDGDCNGMCGLIHVAN
jgi:plastocyanin